MTIAKRPLGEFLARNPFPNGWTDGLFYREKMRAIHRIAPPQLPDGARILEIGGGRSGMAALLYLGARVVTVDIDAALAASQPKSPNTAFVPGDACRLPFSDQSFDLVTMFDVLEHIGDDSRAASEAVRVAKAGGTIAVSTPDAGWRYPYFGFMARYCPHEQVLMDEWGHVRRGYRQSDLERLFGGPPTATATFIGPVTAFYHDVAFSRLRRRQRLVLYALAALPTAGAYLLHRPDARGAELAASWRR